MVTFSHGTCPTTPGTSGKVPDTVWGSTQAVQQEPGVSRWLHVGMTLETLNSVADIPIVHFLGDPKYKQATGYSASIML